MNVGRRKHGSTQVRHTGVWGNSSLRDVIRVSALRTLCSTDCRVSSAIFAGEPHAEGAVYLRNTRVRYILRLRRKMAKGTHTSYVRYRHGALVLLVVHLILQRHTSTLVQHGVCERQDSSAPSSPLRHVICSGAKRIIRGCEVALVERADLVGGERPDGGVQHAPVVEEKEVLLAPAYTSAYRHNGVSYRGDSPVVGIHQLRG